ncbi:MAG TPA: FHA domain-containing protein [Gemmatimonadales bacterium]|nr:FHA domain-containing protein [Gemmatimonadales bacterium]
MLIPRRGGNEGYPVRGRDISIGRVEGNDVVVPDPSVSARHARLRLAEGIWWLSDLGSVGGSAVDDEPVGQQWPLGPGSIVRLGETQLIFSPQDRWEDSLAPTPAPVSAPSPAFVLPDTEPRSSWVPLAIGAGLLLVAVVGWLLTRGG